MDSLATDITTYRLIFKENIDKYGWDSENS
jgi:hypothetical protein